MMRLLFFIILGAGIGNAVLRPEMENPYTLYRLIAPLGLLAALSARPTVVLKYIGVFVAFFLYNFVLASAYSADYSQFFPSIVHYLYLWVLLVLMLDMKARYADFDRQLLRFAKGFYIFLLLNLVLELAFGPYYPNLYVDESDEPSLRAFFWNQNDLSLVLCIVAWFVLALDRFKGPVRVAIFMLTVFLLYYNDSKAALISLLFCSLPVFLVFRICAAVRIPGRVWFFLFAGAFAVAIALLLSVSGADINFANETYSIDDLLVRPIVNILTLQSSGEEWGSLNNRADAAIFVIIEYLRSLGFGLGAGGSWLVLTLPQYTLGGAKSPHNALLQFTVDFGYPVLLGYLYLAYWAMRRLFTHRLGENDRLKVMAILSFPMAGLSQSGAIVTNYFFFAAVSFIWLLGHEAPFSRTAPSASARPARRRRQLPRALGVDGAR